MISGQCIKVLAHWAIETTRGLSPVPESGSSWPGPTGWFFLCREGLEFSWLAYLLWYLLGWGHPSPWFLLCFCVEFSICVSFSSLPLVQDTWCSIRVSPCSDMASSYCICNRCPEIRPHPKVLRLRTSVYMHYGGRASHSSACSRSMSFPEQNCWPGWHLLVIGHAV